MNHHRLVECSLTAVLLAGCAGDAPSQLGNDIGSATSARATPLDPAIMVMGDWDWRRRADGGSRCTDMIDRAAAAGAVSVALVPTHGFLADQIGTTDRGTPLYENRGYCYKSGTSCVPFTTDAIADFELGMRTCMHRAVHHGLDLAVIPHLDDGRFAGAWRNSLIFDPTAHYAGYSYGDVLLYPLARAMRDTMSGTTRIYFALQGEMGATVFAHPAGNHAMLGTIRHMIVGGDGTRTSRVQVGLSINFNFIAGGAPLASQAQLLALLRAADFLGISCYGAVDPYPTASNFDRTIDGFASELAGHGIDLWSLYAHDGLRLHCSEVGIGAGRDGAGNSPAVTRAQAAATPYFGIYGEYRVARDPWQGDVATFRRDYYRALVDYLRGNGRWRVDRAYLWSLDSWDVQAIYPISTSGEGSYRDQVVVDAIIAHNAAARQGSDYPACADPASDPDGDGWGWEGGQSCTTWPACRSAASDPDGDGWGWEDDRSCRVRVTCTDVPTPEGNTCAQQAAWGKCNESWMLANGWCARTCGRC
jgi:hypothetical protein